VRELRAARDQAVDPLEMPAPLSQLPWQVAQKQFGVQGADFLAHLGRLLVFETKKQLGTQAQEITGETDRVAGVASGKAIRARAGSGP